MSNVNGVMIKSAATSPDITSGDFQRQCFERREAQIRAVTREQIIAPTIDGLHAVTVILGAAPKFMRLRARMDKLDGEIDLELVDGIVEIAHAFCYANADYVQIATPSESYAELSQEGIKLRELFFDVMELVVKQGLVQPGQHVTPLRRQAGARNVSQDLTSARRFFDDVWDSVQGKIPITKEQLKRADYIAVRLLENAANRAVTPTEVAEAELVKQQAFTLLMLAYTEVRDAVILLRRKEGDADEIAPSVYSGRQGGRRKTDANGEATEPSVPAASSAGGGNAATLPVAQLTPATQVPVGHLGSNPFTG